MKIVITAAIVYIAFYFAHNFVDIILEFFRYLLDFWVSKWRLKITKLTDDLEREEENPPYKRTEAIGFHYPPDDEVGDDEDYDDGDDDDGEEEDKITRHKHKYRKR